MEQEFTYRGQEWTKRFGLTNWKIQITFDPDCLKDGITQADPRYYRANITFNTSVLDQKEEWDRIIVHELIHIIMSLYDFYVDNSSKEGTDELLMTARESSVSQLTHIILRLLKK